jgi:hypothetical protein
MQTFAQTLSRVADPFQIFRKIAEMIPYMKVRIFTHRLCRKILEEFILIFTEEPAHDLNFIIHELDLRRRAV